MRHFIRGCNLSCRNCNKVTPSLKLCTRATQTLAASSIFWFRCIADFKRLGSALTNKFLVVKEVTSVGAKPFKKKLVKSHQGLGVVRNLPKYLVPVAAKYTTSITIL